METISRRMGTPVEVEPQRLNADAYVPQYVPTPKRKVAATLTSEESDWDEDPETVLVIEEPTRQASSPPPAKVVPIDVYRNRRANPQSPPQVVGDSDNFEVMGKRVADIARLCAGSAAWSAVNDKIQALLDMTGDGRNDAADGGALPLGAKSKPPDGLASCVAPLSVAALTPLSITTRTPVAGSIPLPVKMPAPASALPLEPVTPCLMPPLSVTCTPVSGSIPLPVKTPAPASALPLEPVTPCLMSPLSVICPPVAGGIPFTVKISTPATLPPVPSGPATVVAHPVPSLLMTAPSRPSSTPSPSVSSSQRPPATSRRPPHRQTVEDGGEEEDVLPRGCTPSEAWRTLLRPETRVTFEPPDEQGFRRWQGHPALFFLGAPSEFAPTMQARMLARIRQRARMAQGYRGVRHQQIGVNQVKREEMAVLPDGTIYRMSSTWVEDAEATVSHSRSTQADGDPEYTYSRM